MYQDFCLTSLVDVVPAVPAPPVFESSTELVSNIQMGSKSMDHSPPGMSHIITQCWVS